MRLRNMLKICLVFWKSEPRYAYKLHAYKKKHAIQNALLHNLFAISPINHNVATANTF